MTPDLDLLLAVVARLKQDTTLSALVDGRIFDRVPQKPDGTVNVSSPYISLGPTSATPDDYDCVDGEEITIQIDAWSWGEGEAFSSVEIRKIAGAIKSSLHEADLDLGETALVTLQHELTRVMRDRDGVTNHAAVQFTAVVETQ